MKLIATLNPENASAAEVEKFRTRTAVRTVIFDDNDNMAILNVTRQKYHKLPGGGVEDGEDVYDALKRECQEELGCEIKIVGEVGQIIEFRKIFQLKQISPCYLANVVGEKGKPSFTAEELTEGFQIMWVPITEARQILSRDQALNDEGRWYIVPRDLTFITEAMKLRLLK